MLQVEYSVVCQKLFCHRIYIYLYSWISFLPVLRGILNLALTKMGCSVIINIINIININKIERGSLFMNEETKSLITRANSYAIRNNIENPIITVNSINKTVSVIGENDGARITTEISLFPNGGFIKSSSKFNIKDRKSDYVDEVLQMKDMGYTQVEIATKLGISQSTVSNMIRSSKNII
ncbi:MAG TPA: hypothetical protein DDX68_12920 [Clostridium sp.]|nr:hypothetical protein [Clostridium sp.]